LKRSYLKHLSLTLRAYECEHINEYDGVIPITNKDAAVLRELGCSKPMEAIPFGVQPADVASVPVEPNTLYHLGSMDWIPNQEGVQWFLDKVWPKVHQRLPQLTLYLAGRKMPEEMMNLHVEGVRVVGEVPDAMAFMASKQINVVPLLSGSGIRVKIIEALSAGKVVVTTSIGAEGINYTDGKDLLIADTPDQFVEQLQRCVENAEFCNEVSRNAINLVLHEYDNTLLTERLLQFYQRVLDK
jgi:glycosyltransferase involved in cell wall biosynthesis